MKTAKKRVIILSVCMSLAVVFLTAYHLPRKIQFTGGGYNILRRADALDELSVDLLMWPKLFREPSFTGSVTVNGKRYEGIGHLVNRYLGMDYEPFIPIVLKEEIGETPDESQEKKILEDYLTICRVGASVRVFVHHKQDNPDGSISWTVDGVYRILFYELKRGT